MDHYEKENLFYTQFAYFLSWLLKNCIKNVFDTELLHNLIP